LAQTNDNKLSSVTDDKSSEDEILASAGIPKAYADILKKLSMEENVAIGLRAGAPLQRYAMPCSPKPSMYKAKTGNWGFTKGVIAEDRELGKVEHDKTGARVVKERDDNYDLPKDKALIKTVTHTLSVMEVAAGIESGQFEFVSAKNGRLIVKATDAPTGASPEFSINLLEPASRITKPIDIDVSKVTANLPSANVPNWWDPDWGNFDDVAKNYFPAQVLKGNDFVDIKVFGMEDKFNNVLPITGDQDALWMTRPADAVDNDERYSKVVNTFSLAGTEEMLEVRLNMATREAGDDVDKLMELTDISNSSIARLGCVTGHESRLIETINKRMQQEVEHMVDLFQHGAENRNPGKPSPLDSPMIHFYRGQVFRTENEKELINFTMQPGFIERNIVDINPRWDMSQWSVVVEKQYALKQPIPPLTMAAFVEYQHTSNKPLAADAAMLYIRNTEKLLEQIKEQPGYKPEMLAQKLSDATLKTFVDFKREFKQSVPADVQQLYNDRNIGQQPKMTSSTAMMAGLLGGANNAKTILNAPTASAPEIMPRRTPVTPTPTKAPAVEPENDAPAPTRRFRT
jgi:hypothetical protein